MVLLTQLIIIGLIAQGELSALDILHLSNAKVQSLEQVQYTSHFAYSHKAQAKNNFALTEEIRLHFQAHPKIRTVRFGEGGFDRIYRSDTLIEIEAQQRVLKLHPRLASCKIYSRLSLCASIYELRQVLPDMIQDPSLKIINKQILNEEGDTIYQIIFELDKFVSQGKLRHDGKHTYQYVLKIRQKDFMPLSWKMENLYGFTQASYSDIREKGLTPDLWELNATQKDYPMLFKGQGKCLPRGSSNSGRPGKCPLISN